MLTSASYRVGLAAIAASALVVLAFSASAQASWIPEPGTTLVTVTATSGGETSTYDVSIPPGLIVACRYNWSLPAQAQLHSNGRLLATIDGITLGVDADPGVSLGFVVSAGNADTDFTITSATIPFTPLYNVMAFASAGVTVTDADSDGATLTGLFGGGYAYEARYNSPAVTWATLLGNPVVAGTDNTLTVNDRRPATFRESIPGILSSIQSEWHFKVSAYDDASGTSRFDVSGTEVPEPATLALMAAGGLGALLRRRRK
jgi:hypothetical protein